MTVKGTPPPADALALARLDFAAFCVAMRSDFEIPGHLEALIDALEAIERGELRRLLVSCPPRHGKSLTGSVLFPCWYLGRHPDRFVVVATHSEELAITFGRQVRNFIASPLFRGIFPECKIAGDSSAVYRFDVTGGGGAYFVGRGSSLTGRGCALLVLDDLVRDRAEADSEAIRKSTESWYREVARTRLEPSGAIVGVGTRWHEADLLGRLIAENLEPWKTLAFPALAEPGDPLGRPEGSPLWPERFGADELARIRADVGSRAWSALYQGQPTPAEGSIFRREWFGTFDQRPALGRVIQSWDTAFGKNKGGDYSACATIGESETGYEILHIYKDRPDFPALKKKMAILAEEWPVSAVLVEDAASGASIIQEMRAESRIPVIAVPATSDKVSRWNAVAPLFEAGKVRFQAGAAWLPDVLEELASVPAAKHDDVADAIAQGLTYLRSGAGFWNDPKKFQEMLDRADRKILGLPDVGPETADADGVSVVSWPEEGSWKW
jgi:predicted phage terminase large subunit-like protein